MNEKKFSDEMRKKIATEINSLLYDGFTLEESIITYVQGFYNLDVIQNPLIYLIKSAILTISYLDAYKLYSYKQKEGLTNGVEEDYLGILLNIENTDDLIAEASSDPEFLKIIIAASYEFSEMDELGKILMLKSLSLAENVFLEEMSSFHTFDLERYNRLITLKTLNEAYIQKRSKQILVGGVDFEVAIIMSLYGFVRNLIKLDYDNARELLCEIAKVDYTISKYFQQEKNNKSILNTIDFYEKNDFDMILHRLMTDQDFCREALWNTIDVISKNECNGTILSLDEIKTEESDDFVRKLDSWKEK